MLLSYLVEVCSLFLHTVSLFLMPCFFLEYLIKGLRSAVKSCRACAGDDDWIDPDPSWADEF